MGVVLRQISDRGELAPGGHEETGARSDRESKMCNKVRTDDRYRGLREDGRPWPEVLKGTKEIARFLRMHPE